VRPVIKIAAGAGLGGLTLAVAVASVLRAPSPVHIAALPAVESPPANPTPARCRTITMPDNGCDAAWQARRRHFFEKDDKR
jgi:conjugative transfer region protein TrbK